MKRFRTEFSTVLVILIAACFLSGCETIGKGGDGGEASNTRPSSFLKTDYAPLDEWFEERFEVKYKNMTPAMIFDQVPINDIHYELQSLPESASTFDYESDNISRREILEKIADFWDLKMSILNGPDGNPSSVIVKG